MAVRDLIEKASVAVIEWDFVDGKSSLPILMAKPIPMVSGLESSVFERHGAYPLITRWFGN
jgi:hypothetical protein